MNERSDVIAHRTAGLGRHAARWGLAVAMAAGMACPALAGPDEVLAQENLKFEVPELLVGDPAPGLALTHWVQGEEVTSFRPDHVYVVEFWATWCGPCIAGFPHLTKLQEQYEGRATIIGVNIWERASGQERVDFVSNWVSDRTDMGYPVAIDGQKKMEETWMAAGGRQGIPSAFIVDGTGMIAWVGHPGRMDSALERIVEKDWNIEEAAERYVRDMRGQAWMNVIFGHFQAKRWERAYEVGRALLERDLSENSEMLNQLSWIILTHPAVEIRDIPFALAAAERASELNKHEDADILDTLARAYFMSNEIDRAIEVQRAAIEHANDDGSREAYEKVLAEYIEARGAR